MVYDTIVIGAGIAGCSVAYFLKQKNQKVLLVDKKGIASGGSGAAGAFISPKVGIDLPLKQLSDEAFRFVYDLYTKNFSQFYHPTGVARIPKDANDALKFAHYAKFHTIKHDIRSVANLASHHINSPFDSVFFPQAGICDPKGLCHAMVLGIDFLRLHVDSITKQNNLWEIGDKKATNLVLATGFENDLVDMRYMSVEGIWGNRADFRSSLLLDISLHQNISISTNMEGFVKIGATHERKVKTPKPCDEIEVNQLLAKASKLVDTSDFKLSRVFCGMRASNRDYTPVAGNIIDVEAMLKCPNILNGRKYPLVYHENLFVLNALGARGFVFAPYVANELANHIVYGKEIDSRIHPDRLFWNWIRKANKK